ncbi:hypothetical protein RFI_04586 [Reticulomyxa filosa]|uniref:Uncharacterized protein n=1 Tax=Reticulomyxa filosa TaxID=46433 RepID=X6P2S6_RETFI|nr:hypothetical protein RFI_04586 [Reticulomyxa filosa]|eukprot:ETO32531.1 hypothetical protein RFI_04586 [Reticulomyxa filosa]
MYLFSIEQISLMMSVSIWIMLLCFEKKNWMSISCYVAHDGLKAVSKEYNICLSRNWKVYVVVAVSSKSEAKCNQHQICGIFDLKLRKELILATVGKKDLEHHVREMKKRIRITIVFVIFLKKSYSRTISKTMFPFFFGKNETVPKFFKYLFIRGDNVFAECFPRKSNSDLLYIFDQKVVSRNGIHKYAFQYRCIAFFEVQKNLRWEPLFDDPPVPTILVSV